MKYQDKVYGEFEFHEKVVLELIQDPLFQRLKHIDQGGYRPFLIQKFGIAIDEYEHSRFAHSLGVYLLLLKYGASIEEQIAGLIHDVSHLAFSHCIDYVLAGGKYNYQDAILEEYVKKSSLATIIKKHGFDLDYILDDENFPLKERPLPELCADRIDYSLRTAVIFGEIEQVELKSLLSNLTVENDKWVFKTFESAKRYAEIFLRLNNEYYCGLTSATMFQIVSDCLKHSLKKGYIDEKDLYTTDKEVLEKIKRFLSVDRTLFGIWKKMNNEVQVTNDPQNFDVKISGKSRVVDPLFKEGNTVHKVSEKDPSWKKVVAQELKPKEYFLKYHLKDSSVL